MRKVITSLVLLTMLISEKAFAAGVGADYIMNNGLKISSEDGRKCYEAIRRHAKWKVEIKDPDVFIVASINKRVENEENCKMNNYTFYTGEGAILFYNGFGGAKEEQTVCVKNNNTGKFSALVGEQNFDDLYSSVKRIEHRNSCELFENVSKAIEGLHVLVE